MIDGPELIIHSSWKYLTHRDHIKYLYSVHVRHLCIVHRYHLLSIPGENLNPLIGSELDILMVETHVKRLRAFPWGGRVLSWSTTWMVSDTNKFLWKRHFLMNKSVKSMYHFSYTTLWICLPDFPHFFHEIQKNFWFLSIWNTKSPSAQFKHFPASH